MSTIQRATEPAPKPGPLAHAPPAFFARRVSRADSSDAHRPKASPVPNWIAAVIANSGAHEPAQHSQVTNIRAVEQRVDKCLRTGEVAQEDARDGHDEAGHVGDGVADGVQHGRVRSADF